MNFGSLVSLSISTPPPFPLALSTYKLLHRRYFISLEMPSVVIPSLLQLLRSSSHTLLYRLGNVSSAFSDIGYLFFITARVKVVGGRISISRNLTLRNWIIGASFIFAIY